MHNNTHHTQYFNQFILLYFALASAITEPVASPFLLPLPMQPVFPGPVSLTNSIAAHYLTYGLLPSSPI
jgi:hypothetical protein